MSNIMHVFSHEINTKKRSAGLKTLFVIMQVLLLVSLLTGWSQYERTSVMQQQTQALVEQQWAEQPDRHPHRVAHFGHFTFRPPGALSFFDVGVSNFLGNSIFIEAHRQNSANFANDYDAATLLRFSELSVANILLVIWPLLLIAFAFNTVSAERQFGTLRQLLAIGVSLRHVIIGKGLGYLALTLAFLSPIFIATLILIGVSSIELTADVLLRVGLLAILYLLYCVFWIVVVLLISSIVKEPKHVLASLISCWFVLTILMPRMVADYAATADPILKRNDLELAVKLETKKVGDSHNPNDPHFNSFKEGVLKEYGVNTVEELPINYRGLVMAEGERISAEIFANFYQQEQDKLKRQQARISAFYWINPYMLARDLSMALARSDAWHFYDFELQSEAHRYARTQKLNEIHTNHIELAHDRDQKASSEFWQDFDKFEYQAPNLAQSLAPFSQIWPVLALLLVVLTSLLLSSFVSRRVYAHA